MKIKAPFRLSHAATRKHLVIYALFAIFGKREKHYGYLELNRKRNAGAL